MEITVLTHEAVGAKIYKLVFFSILFFIKNVISNLMDICKTIQWKKKKSHRNGVKITTLPNNQHTPAPPQLTPPPLPLNITSQKEWAGTR